MKYALRVALCCAVVLGLSTAARADLLTGRAWVNVEAYNAIAPGSTPDVTFTSNSFSFDLPNQGTFTLGNLLTAIGANNIVGDTTHVLSTGGCTLGAPYTPCKGTLIEFSGTAHLVNGATYSITHDDGISLYVGGNLVPGFTSSPVAATTQSFTFNDPTGDYAFDLVYSEVNGAPGVLTASRNLEFVPEPASIVLLGTMLVGTVGIVRRRISQV